MNHHDLHSLKSADEIQPTAKDYVLFIGVLLFIFFIALGYEHYRDFDGESFMRTFMGVFFLVFSFFKLLDLKGFVMSYTGYDIIAKRFIGYAYLYPFIELALSFGYFLNLPYINFVTLILMIVGAIGVGKQLLRKSKIKCACLGTYINLPLTTVSLTEDIAMGVMALIAIML